MAGSLQLGHRTSHEKTGLPCQDAGGCRIVCDPAGRQIFLGIACDGAGSASRSLDGAILTVASFLDEFGGAAKRSGLDEFTKEFVQDWLSRLRTEMKDQADAEDLNPRDFACTVLAAIVGEAQAAFFQIGDGAIVVSNRSEPDDYGWVFWPQHGEFANQMSTPERRCISGPE
jgi:serine/threonine protein phosphatase PrpC